MAANFLGDGDFELQVRTTLSNLDRVLDAFGAGKMDIVQTTVYVKNLPKHFDAIERLHAEYFGTAPTDKHRSGRCGPCTARTAS